MSFAAFLNQNQSAFASIFEPALTRNNSVQMDLSSSSREFAGLDECALDEAILQKLASAGAIAGVGGYLENRSLYQHTDLFQGDSERCIHIGVDVFMPAETPLYAPLDSVVQSFANRQVSGDYGPVIILRHELDGFEFHSLYGHLSVSSLHGLSEGKRIFAGEQFARIGARPGNGNWPPHLHFQLVRDMQGFRGDYPGVVRPDELDFITQNCPDPMSLLVQEMA
ncbi:MAG: peptidoglycan DD-metalloendopeptidase family protein [Gammaproteobacteria bacterium]|nr:peptidoglycan DD-metalloendopeptidase family protein [Gammaproteobacteria bacterium]